MVNNVFLFRLFVWFIDVIQAGLGWCSWLAVIHHPIYSKTRRSFPGTALFLFAHDDVIKWKYFPRHWPFVRGIHRSPTNSPPKVEWRGALVFSLICGWKNNRENNIRDADDLGRYRDHYNVIVMCRYIIELSGFTCCHDDVPKWKHFPRYWPFERIIHRSPMSSPHKGRDVELWYFLWSALEYMVELTIVRLVIWDAISPIMTSL